MSKEPEPKCDLCDVVVSLYQHEYGWRCPACIWAERTELRHLLLKITEYLGPLPGLDFIRKSAHALIFDTYPSDTRLPKPEWDAENNRQKAH